MAEKFVGTWTMVESENLDDYLKAMGVGFAIRQVAKRAKPSVIISVDSDGTVTLKTQRTEVKFKINEEFEKTTGDDRKTKNVVSLDNGRLVQRQTWDDKETIIEREVVDNKLIVKCKMGDVVAVRKYVKEA